MLMAAPPGRHVPQGRRPEAEAEFRAVVTQRPSCPLALGNLAGVLYDQVGLAVFKWCVLGSRLCLPGWEHIAAAGACICCLFASQLCVQLIAPLPPAHSRSPAGQA